MKTNQPPLCRTCNSPMEYSGPSENSRANGNYRIRRLAQWTCSKGGHQTRYAYTRRFPHRFGWGGWSFISLEEAVIASGQLKKNVGIKVYGTSTVLSAKRLHMSQFGLKLWRKDRDKLLKGIDDYIKT
jgi:hypothetical protein